MEKKKDKDCMFQYIYDTGVYEGFYNFSNIVTKEDTGLITEKKAMELWEEYFIQSIGEEC